MRAEIDAARKALGDPGHIVFPPAAEKALAGAGLPLAELLRLQLTDNDPIRVMLGDVSGHHYKDWSNMTVPVHYHCDATAMLDGYFLWHQREWPADLGRYDLFVEWCDTGGRHFPLTQPVDRRGILDGLVQYNPAAKHILADAHVIARVVRDRYQATMALLRSGDLEATGHMKGGAPAPLSLAVWSSATTRINFAESAVCKCVSVDVAEFQWGRVRAERIEPIWSDVTVRRPVRVGDTAKPEIAPAATKGKSGRKPFIPWGEGIDLLMVRLSKVGTPETGAELTAMMVDCLIKAGLPNPNEDTVKLYLRENYPHLWNEAKKK